MTTEERDRIITELKALPSDVQGLHEVILKQKLTHQHIHSLWVASNELVVELEATIKSLAKENIKLRAEVRAAIAERDAYSLQEN